MRSLGLPLYSFIDYSGKQNSVHDMIEIPKYETAIQIDNFRGSMPDEIMTRKDIGGLESEILIYQIVEANIADIVENDLDFSKMPKIRIPPI